MSGKVVVTVAWVLWAVLLVVLLGALIWAVLDPGRSPEVSSGLAPLLVGILLVLHLAFGGLLYWLALRGWTTALAVLAALVGVPILLAAARPAVMAYKTWTVERAATRAGDFSDPVLRPMAEAVRAGDSAQLADLLGGKPPPAGRDEAGNDLLAFALAELRDGQAEISCLRALLDAGADPRTSRNSDGQDPLNFMLLGDRDNTGETIILLLKHGADPNAVDPVTGDTPIAKAGHDPGLVRGLVEAGADMDRIQSDGVTALVGFVGSQRWDSAVYLIEQGADLDVSRDDGLSLAYYEKSWETSVLGEHPEGWERVKRSVAGRRAAAATEDAGAAGQ